LLGRQLPVRGGEMCPLRGPIIGHSFPFASSSQEPFWYQAAVRGLEHARRPQIEAPLAPPSMACLATRTPMRPRGNNVPKPSSNLRPSSNHSRRQPRWMLGHAVVHNPLGSVPQPLTSNNIMTSADDGGASGPRPPLFTPNKIPDLSAPAEMRGCRPAWW
jgi:hypothetical protein